MNEKISPRKKGLQNAKNYAEYIANLERNGKKFPLSPNTGEVNKTAVAAACGFNRQVFASNEKMAVRLAADVGRIGLMGMSDELIEDLADEPVLESESSLAKKLKKANEQIGKLKKDLALKEATMSAHEAQIIKLENENAQLNKSSAEQRNSFDFIVSTGRRFTL